MNKKEVFLRILKTLNRRPYVRYLCTDSVVHCDATEHQAFKAWLLGMLEGQLTLGDWLYTYHADIAKSLRWDYRAYRKAWIKHLINYLESLP